MIIDTELINMRRYIRTQSIRESYFNLGRPLAQGATILGTQVKEYIIHKGEMVVPKKLWDDRENSKRNI